MSSDYNGFISRQYAMFFKHGILFILIAFDHNRLSRNHVMIVYTIVVYTIVGFGNQYVLAYKPLRSECKKVNFNEQFVYITRNTFNVIQLSRVKKWNFLVVNFHSEIPWSTGCLHTQVSVTCTSCITTLHVIYTEKFRTLPYHVKSMWSPTHILYSDVYIPKIYILIFYKL